MYAFFINLKITFDSVNKAKLYRKLYRKYLKRKDVRKIDIESEKKFTKRWWSMVRVKKESLDWKKNLRKILHN